jgi:transposase-like protein
MARRRYTRDEKAEFLKKFRRSDGNAAAFCRKHRVPYYTFLGWQRGLGRRPGPAAARSTQTRFVELEVKRDDLEDPRPLPSPAVVELVLGAGMILRIYPGHGGRP